MTEFELIARYFARPPRMASTRLGIGDDCALLALRPGFALAVSSDMLVENRHFFADVEPAALGWKALAVNLSDLAAMGAKPLGFTLALALPAVDEAWLRAFSRGLFACADAFDCDLVGGDTTRGPLTLSITVFGEVPEGEALRRDGARAGDDVFVSGPLGGAAFALQALRDGLEPDGEARRALERPQPRVGLGRALAGIASAAIDISDGFAQDLGHVLERSRVGAVVGVVELPLFEALSMLPDDDARRLALAGGDDYELCFTAPPARRDAVIEAAASCGFPAYRVGRIVEGTGLAFTDASGQPWQPATPLRGFDHFA